MRLALLSGLVSITVGALGTPAHGSPVVAEPPASARATSVTLITGDRVVLGASGSTAVQPGPGRAGTRFVTTRTKQGRSVIPVDALPLLKAGRLDERLFNVTTLAEAGYTDELPLLVEGRSRRASAVDGVTVKRDLPVVGAVAVRADRQGRAELWKTLTTGTNSARSLRAGVDHIWLDGKRKISLDVSVPQIGAPAAWQAGLDGTGVTVAVLDTGIDATHPDLAGQIAESANFTTTASTDDEVGHGTHVASTIAGTGAASGGRYKGVAPGAKLAIGKVCGTSFCEESDILAGMAWAATRAPVVNMSLGGGDSESIDPLEAAVNDLTAQYGTLFVIAAGNAGGDATVGSPASADAALAVGAVDRDDQLADFSSRGPRVGDNAIKPEITAPGVEIVAAKAAHDVIGGPAPVAGYSSLSGTSMATPHVAGAAAILTQQHPGWSPNQRKTVLMGAAQPTEGVTVYGQGAGRVDVARAITQQVAVDEGTVSFRGGLWPHDDDQPETRTVTYRNDGTTAVTLSLALSAPAEVFTLAATTLTVPAGGTATTTITADTSADVEDGFHSGYLTATAAGGLRVETPVGVFREPESYNVAIDVIDRAGNPAENSLVVLFEHNTGSTHELQGSGTKRLPKGEYGLFSFIGDEDTTLLAQPRLFVTDDSTIRVDARVAKPVKVTVPTAGAVNTLLVASAEWQTDAVWLGAGAGGDDTVALYTGQLGPRTPFEPFTASINASYARADAAGTLHNSPYTYDLAWFSEGTMYDGFRKNVRTRDLATIKASYAAAATGATGVKANSARHGDAGSWSVYIPFDLPFQRTEYVNTDGGATWAADFYQQAPPPTEDDWPVDLSYLSQPPAQLRAGKTYRQEWNKGVFAPSVAGVSSPYDFVFRIGDTLYASPPTHGDGAGHPGYSTLDSARLALYRDGKPVSATDTEYGQFELPAGPGNYRLDLVVNRSAPHTLSTKVTGSWTFRSGHVAGADPQRIAMSTIRWSPPLSDHNVGRAGRVVTVPVHVDQQVASRVGKVTTEVSFDDGRTWRPVPVKGSGDHRSIEIRHPGRAGFVSLRGTATTRAGTVGQTVIRAYPIS
ncbi:S8 family serine peptidase [Actinoplanes sp. NPDC051494]|uniref:S8 family serine peptidase n=1 Tax=Actinoplanes sp. NPDC051494 TaxID=3363907 RepID=UPI0037919CD0